MFCTVLVLSGVYASDETERKFWFDQSPGKDRIHIEES